VASPRRSPAPAYVAPTTGSSGRALAPRRLAFAAALLLAWLPASAPACGWWGDAEHDVSAPAVTVGAHGRPRTHAAGAGRLDELVLTADRFRTGDRLPRDPAQALARYRMAAEAGHTGAQYNLARMYEQGIGTAPDPQRAARWYLAAADAGEVHAQHHLGEMYRDGHGVPRDLGRATAWIRRAAEAGHSEVYVDLARSYWSGAGVPRDPVEAYVWWRRAAEAGDARGVEGAARAAGVLDEAGHAKAERRLRSRGGDWP